MQPKILKFNKWIILKLVVLVVLASTFCICSNFVVAKAEETESAQTFSSNNYILSDNERLLSDFADNKYVLKEVDNYYSITHAATGLLIEENDGNWASPYKGFDKIWYAGPMNYFYEINNKVYTLIDNTEIEVNQNIYDYCNKLNDFIIQEYNRQHSAAKKARSTYADKIDYYELKYPTFFPNLDTTEHNLEKICTYVAAASLLAYYDYCYGTNSFIDSSYWERKNLTNPRYYKSLCLKLENYHENDSFEGVMKKYFKDRNQTNVKHYQWAGIFTTNLMLCDSIKKNNPVVLMGLFYDPRPNESKPANHAVIAYKASCSYINGSTIYSYWLHYGWEKEFNSIRLTNNITNFTVLMSYYLNVK